MLSRRRAIQISAAAAAATAPLIASAPAGAAGNFKRPLVIGHRGASGYRPEHTLAAYELAARMGADYIEPDLVITSDGVLVARHENEISGTTDVATRPEFAGRRIAKTIDGVSLTGWFTEDFTLAELKTLRAIERIPGVRQRNTIFNGYFEVPTLDEVLRLRARLSHELHREIGIYPETKHPSYFRSIGKPLEEPLVRALRRHGLDHRFAPVFVQSFEAANLRELADQVKVKLVFLAAGAGSPFNDPRSYDDYLTPAGLAELASFVDGVGPAKARVLVGSLVGNAHAAGLAVHPWTFRAENQFLPADLRLGTDPNAFGKAIDEQIAFLRAGVDGLFTDNPDIGILARDLSGR